MLAHYIHRDFAACNWRVDFYKKEMCIVPISWTRTRRVVRWNYEPKLTLCIFGLFIMPVSAGHYVYKLVCCLSVIKLYVEDHIDILFYGFKRCNMSFPVFLMQSRFVRDRTLTSSLIIFVYLSETLEQRHLCATAHQATWEKPVKFPAVRKRTKVSNYHCLSPCSNSASRKSN